MSRDRDAERRYFRRQVFLLSALSGGAALLVAVAGFAAIEYYLFRESLREKFFAITAVIADNSAPALAFGDERAATEVLASLRSVPEVTHAALFGPQGRVFARYGRQGAASPQSDPRPSGESVDFTLEAAEIRRPVRLGEDTLGHLLVVADLRELYSRLLWYGIASLALVSLALGAGTLLLRPLRRRLTRAEEALSELTLTLEERVKQRTEELERSNRELESFAYSVSHDLRAPARAMAGFAAILRQDYGSQLPEEVLRSIARIEEGAVQMGRLIDALLELSRAGRSALRPVRVPMGALAASVVRELAARARDREIAIGALPDCQGDAILLRQVWINLIDNAVKFTRGTPSPRIEIGGERRDRFAEYWVRDNGVGFDMRYAGKLFGVFERLHRPGEFEGTGAGLAIVKRIIERHGGTVSAEGAPGKGATFRFTVPLRAKGP
ncbi:MAG: ATP-binding protein [Pseudomonadota bacterium]